MVNFRLAALAAALVAAVTATASAQQATQAGVGAALPDGKVAVVNTQVFPGAIGELKQKYEQVNNQFKDRYQKLQALVEQMKGMENDLRTKQQVLTPDKYQELQNTYTELKKRGEREQEDLNADADKALDIATKPVRDKMTQFLNTYAAQRNIILVFNLAGAAQTGSLAYWNPGTDITDDFVAEYNKANPVAGAAAATPPPAQPAKPAVRPPAKP
ncbi:MAG TPA: OmpH family outer membrane protein [Blastocatellia bacterium]|nr:OmpH family outer membrane protein [Blastocatellia bacterium]